MPSSTDSMEIIVQKENSYIHTEVLNVYRLSSFVFCKKESTITDGASMFWQALII